jgi:hypothetical protein
MPIFGPFSRGVRAQPHGETMSFATSSENHAAGARRMNLTMLAARDRADSFPGLPSGVLSQIFGWLRLKPKIGSDGLMG